MSGRLLDGGRGGGFSGVSRVYCPTTFTQKSHTRYQPSLHLGVTQRSSAIAQETTCRAANCRCLIVPYFQSVAQQNEGLMKHVFGNDNELTTGILKEDKWTSSLCFSFFK